MLPLWRCAVWFAGCGTWFGRQLLVLLLAASAVQFGYFYFDFFTHYKFRSAFYYDPVAFRDVAGELTHTFDDAPQYYFTTDVDDASVKWRFYATLEGRTDLLSRQVWAR